MAERRAARAREKWRQEIDTYHRALDGGTDALTVADELIHYTIKLMESGLRSQHPDATDAEIKALMRERVMAYDRVKKRGRELRNGRI
jgi:nitrogenase molybdenum-iron protein alpha/beta subunit